jgi:hypothetical protein
MTISNDVRRKYIMELTKDKDSWIVILTYILWLLGLSVAFGMAGDKIIGKEWLGILVGPVLIAAYIGGFLKWLVGNEKKLNRSSDEMLELLYSEMEKKKHFKKLGSQIFSSIVFVGVTIVLFLAFSSEKENIVKKVWRNISTDAKCSVISKTAVSDSFIVSGEPDYGITVRANLKNLGKKGNAYVEVNLSTSEGVFVRKQSIYMKEGAAQNLAFKFHEPSVNATNISYYVSCSP